MVFVLEHASLQHVHVPHSHTCTHTHTFAEIVAFNTIKGVTITRYTYSGVPLLNKFKEQRVFRQTDRQCTDKGQQSSHYLPLANQTHLTSQNKNILTLKHNGDEQHWPVSN